MVEGQNIRQGLRRHMDVFRGIPFAGIPGRFEKPKRHPGWDGGSRDILIYLYNPVSGEILPQTASQRQGAMKDLNGKWRIHITVVSFLSLFFFL